MYVVCLVSEVKGFWVDKSNVQIFFSLLSCLFCHCYLGQANATRRVLAGAGENLNLHDSWPRF